jgi:hypothetical protein
MLRRDCFRPPFPDAALSEEDGADAFGAADAAEGAAL